jgi:hypothetical protein
VHMHYSNVMTLYVCMYVCMCGYQHEKRIRCKLLLAETCSSYAPSVPCSSIVKPVLSLWDRCIYFHIIYEKCLCVYTFALHTESRTRVCIWFTHVQEHPLNARNHNPLPRESIACLIPHSESCCVSFYCV